MGEMEDRPLQEAETERKSMEKMRFRPKYGARRTPSLPAGTAETTAGFRRKNEEEELRGLDISHLRTKCY
jgi:hypothetical protein